MSHSGNVIRRGNMLNLLPVNTELNERPMIFYSLFAHAPKIVPVAEGEALFREGEDGNLMYVLAKGTAEIVIGNRVIETLTQGGIVGEVGLALPGPRSATVLAVSDCEFVAIDQKRFAFLVQETPFFAMEVIKVLAQRLLNTNQLLAPVEDI